MLGDVPVGSDVDGPGVRDCLAVAVVRPGVPLLLLLGLHALLACALALGALAHVATLDDVVVPVPALEVAVLEPARAVALARRRGVVHEGE